MAAMTRLSFPCSVAGGLRGFGTTRAVICENNYHFGGRRGRGEGHWMPNRRMRRGNMSSSTTTGHDTTALGAEAGADNYNAKGWGFIGLGRMG